MRDNLDPMGRHSDRELIAVLKATRLWDILCGVSLSQSKGLVRVVAAQVHLETCMIPGMFPSPTMCTFQSASRDMLSSQELGMYHGCYMHDDQMLCRPLQGASRHALPPGPFNLPRRLLHLCEQVGSRPLTSCLNRLAP